MGLIALAVVAFALLGAGFCLLVVSGRLTIDLGLGRRVRKLGPISVTIAASPDTVFDVIEGPYKRTPWAMQDKLRVWERTGDMVLAEHLTKTGPLTTSTVETVTFERPHRIGFRLVRGPVPHVIETYELKAAGESTEFVYSGEIGADLWLLGSWWAARIAGLWERAVADSLANIQAEAERLSRR